MVQTGGAGQQNPEKFIGEYDEIVWQVNGKLKIGTNLDGLKSVKESGTIIKIIVSQKERGESGSMIFDINKYSLVGPITTQQNDISGVTIYTTQANRPTITGDNLTKKKNALIEAALPDIVTFNANDFFSLDIDSEGNNSRDAVIKMIVRYN